MKPKHGKPHDALQRIFHEPNRLAIMSALCASDTPMTFNELKAQCALTDGNLSRHLKVLAETNAVRIKKAFVDAKPRTTVHISSGGVEQFNEYLQALAAVLQEAQKSLPRAKRSAATVSAGLRAEA